MYFRLGTFRPPQPPSEFRVFQACFLPEKYSPIMIQSLRYKLIFQRVSSEEAIVHDGMNLLERWRSSLDCWTLLDAVSSFVFNGKSWQQTSLEWEISIWTSWKLWRLDMPSVNSTKFQNTWRKSQILFTTCYDFCEAISADLICLRIK